MKKGMSILLCLLVGVLTFAKAETVKVYYKPLMSWAPIIIAYEEGYFKEQGIDVEFVKVRNTAEALLLLMQGSLDVVSGPITAGFFNLADKGKNVKIVAGSTIYRKDNNFAGIICSKYDNSDTSPIQNLKGKKIGLPIYGSMPHYFIEKILKKNNVATEDVEFSMLPFFLINVAFNKKTIDAGLQVEPFITKLQNINKQTELISFGNEFPDTPIAYQIYGPNIIDKNKELGVRYLVAYLKGYQQYKEGKTERNITILGKHIKLEEALLHKMEWPNIDPEGIYERKILGEYQKWLLKNNYIENMVSMKAIFDTSFLKKAKKNSGWKEGE